MRREEKETRRGEPAGGVSQRAAAAATARIERRGTKRSGTDGENTHTQAKGRRWRTRTCTVHEVYCSVVWHWLVARGVKKILD